MPIAYLTADLPGVGGRIKERPEDFLVEEQPAYEPSGEGEHLYLFIEKTNQTTMDIVRRLAKAFDVRQRDVGYAGLKDKLAITRQHFSIWLPGSSRDQAGIDQLKDSPAKVLWAARHGNKLRRGHHGGNRFAIRIRGVEMAKVLQARKILDRIIHTGVPNYVGVQRFGFTRSNHKLGRFLLRSQWQEFLDMALGEDDPILSDQLRQARQHYREHDYTSALEVLPRSLRHDRQLLDALRQGRDARHAVLALDPQHRDFLASALQSAMFNRVLLRRVGDGLLDKLVPGDLAWKHDNGAVFAVDEATAEKENAPDGRATQKLVSASGPMWGPGMTQPAGQVLASEIEAITKQTMTLEEMTTPNPHAHLQGQRRPLRLILKNPDISAGGDEHGPFLRVAFELDRGAFATVVLSEIIKPTDNAPLETAAESDLAS